MVGKDNFSQFSHHTFIMPRPGTHPVFPDQKAECWVPGLQLRERVKAGLARAKRQGKRLGRPRGINLPVQAIRRRRKRGETVEQIAQHYKTSVCTVVSGFGGIVREKTVRFCRLIVPSPSFPGGVGTFERVVPSRPFKGQEDALTFLWDYAR